MPLYGDAKREYARQWVAKRKAEFYSDKHCVRCGGNERLELDHIDPDTKVSHSIWSWSEPRRLAEIAKCQILCHMCHVRKTKQNAEHVRGEAHGQAKLNKEKVLEIREKIANGITQRSLAAEYGVHNSVISNINTGKLWQHV